MACLLFYAHYNLSSTDKECQWNAPKQRSSDDVPHTLQAMYPQKQAFRASKRDLSPTEIQEFHKNLGPTSVVGFSWLLKPELNEEFFNLLPSIEHILYSAGYMNAEYKNDYLLSKSSITKDVISQIAIDTIGQHANEKWLVGRKLRLTSSKFGMVIDACHRNKYPNSLMKNLLEGYNLQRVLAVQWGKDNEQTALQKFMEVSHLAVVPTGMWIDESGILAASPDGLIGNDAVLEIKCPYKYREASLKTGVQDKKYLYYYENGKIIIQKQHAYYHQVQGQLYLTNRERCYFFIWTPNEREIFIINKDPSWECNIDILKYFYFNTFIPFVLKNK